jgi:hypothetical protein
MYDRNDTQNPGGGIGFTAVVVGVVLGAAAYLLNTKQGKQILEQVGIRADDWKAQAAVILAETREKVVSSVEAETPPSNDFSDRPGPQVRQNP